MDMSMRDYLAFRCNEMLKMEREIKQMNATMMMEVQNPRLKEAFQHHDDPTDQQIRNLEQVLDHLGGGPQQREGFLQRIQGELGMASDQGTPVTHGMRDEHQKFMAMNPPQSMVDLNDALEGDKVEHLEMASYNGLIALAKQLGDNDIVQMLQQNLRGEEGMCTLLEGQLPTLLNQFGGQMAA